MGGSGELADGTFVEKWLINVGVIIFYGIWVIVVCWLEGVSEQQQAAGRGDSAMGPGGAPLRSS